MFTLGILEVVVLVLIAVALVLMASSRVRSRRWDPEHWARDMGLQLDGESQALIRSYLRRTRILRLAGGLAGLLAPVLYGWIAGRPLPRPFDFGLFDALTGYLVGVVVAEVTFGRPTPAKPTASLVPRQLHDYLPSGLSTALRGGAAVALALIPVYFVFATSENSHGDWNLIPVVVLAPMIVLVLVGTEILQRFIVGRPQPAASAALVEADDAVRSASVRALAGASISLQLLFIAVELSSIGGASDVDVVRFTLPWVGFACFLGAISVWMRASKPEDGQMRRARVGTAS